MSVLRKILRMNKMNDPQCTSALEDLAIYSVFFFDLLYHLFTDLRIKRKTKASEIIHLPGQFENYVILM